MAKKTVVRQLCKWLPASAEMTAALTLDGTVRTQVSALVDVAPDYVDGDAVSETPAIESSPEPPVDVVMASKAQLAKLAQIRAAEKYDADSDWLGYLGEVLGIVVAKESDLTTDQAADIINLFSDGGAA